MNRVTSYASNPVSTIKCLSGSFTIPRDTEREREREREIGQRERGQRERE